MADILLNSIINQEIGIREFQEWFTTKNQNDDEFDNINCSKQDFITYFLNFIHEDILSKTELFKSNTPKRLETPPQPDNLIKRRTTLFPSEESPKFDTPNLSNDASSSTPKLFNPQINNSVYQSPVSPIYRNNASFTTPKNKKEKASPFCLGDFIVAKKGSTAKKKSAARRINPTNLCNNNSNSQFSACQNSFNFETSELLEGSPQNANEQRSILEEERLKIQSRKNTTNDLKLVPVRARRNSEMVKVEADLGKLKCKEQLDLVVEVYKQLLSCNCYLNVTSEIYFLISLLLNKQYDDGVALLDDSGTDLIALQLFDTLHNVVYFACKSIELFEQYLQFYDKQTLKLLANNARLVQFLPHFSKRLLVLADAKSQSDRNNIPLEDFNAMKNVCFISDTDNRNNFPLDVSFHSFRKQRDMFYEILRVWENSHSLAGWSFALSLAGKIRALFNLSSEPANFMHFARLFKAQLLSTCGKLQKEEGLTENQVPFLSFPNVDAEKLNKLKSRIITKQSSKAINAPPVFTGYQEFYSDFIVVASNHNFNKHLCDNLAAEIIDLNDIQFIGTDLIDSESEVDLTTKQAYASCIKSLRVLAKFLGFVEVLPYKSECKYSDHVAKVLIQVRKHSQFTLDVKKILLDAIKAQTLVLTIPWMTKYLAMFDTITLRLPYYLNLFKILFQVYQTNNLAIVKFSLGWLFELPHFPDSEFFNFCSTNQNVAPNSANASLSLDKLKIVDQNILYICCPYLEEVRKLLTSVSSSHSTTKHITPITAIQSTNNISQKRLDTELQEAFFNGQPISVRKTVEFVSERIASSYVKMFCNSVLPLVKSNFLNHLTEVTEAFDKENSSAFETDRERFESELKAKLEEAAESSWTKLLETCEQKSCEIINEKIEPCIEHLLSIDVMLQTKKVCVEICRKNCKERIRQWIHSHVQKSIFGKEVESQLESFIKYKEGQKAVLDLTKAQFVLPPGGRLGIKHNASALSGAHLLQKAQSTMIYLMNNKADSDELVIYAFLAEAQVTVSERVDVNDLMNSSIASIIMEMATIHCAYRSDLNALSKRLKYKAALKSCTENSAHSHTYGNLLSLRNVYILNTQSTNSECAWSIFGKLCALLVQSNVIDSGTFESQCTGIFKVDWDPRTLKYLTTFMSTFVDEYKSLGGEHGKFTYLLEFLSDFCADLY